MIVSINKNIQKMSHTKNPIMVVEMLVGAIAVVVLIAAAVITTINIQTAAAETTYLTKGTIDGINNAREKTATVLGLHEKLKNNCSGFARCTNTATETFDAVGG